jgi:hypothetical protein
LSSLKLSYKAEDANAKVSVSGNNLNVGKNTVSIVVKAENGATKTYTISVVRKQDPNYQASSNANLGSMSVNKGTISPVFSADVKDYVVYLPYESVGTGFSATGVAADKKAQGVTSGDIEKLVEGVNKTTVVCRAEDGTETKYFVTVVVMPKYSGTLPTITGVATDDDTEDVTTEDNTESIETTESTETIVPSTENENVDDDDSNSDGSKVVKILLLVSFVVNIALGIIARYVSRRKEK